MTIEAQLSDRSGRPLASGHDHATHGMHANHPFVVDSFALLDHRTRDCLIPFAGAPAGRYLAVEDAGDTWLVSLQRPITHVGRGLIADVRVEDSHVSRRHAIIALRGGRRDGVRVLDDRSANGTFVNGRRVTTARLSDGDVLRFGRAVFRYLEIVPAAMARSPGQTSLRVGARRRERECEPGPAAA